MHPRNDVLRSFLDGELPSNELHRVQEHINQCAECQSHLDFLRKRADQVKLHLDILSSPPKPQLTQQAFTRFNKNLIQGKEKYPTMKNRKPLWTSIAIIAVLAIAFSLTPVRAWASDFLSLFRVQKITVVQFNPQNAEQVSESLSARQDAIQQILDENLEVNEEGNIVDVSSIDEAAAMVGFTPRLPGAMLDAKLSVQPAIQARLTIDQPAMQAILDVMDSGVDLPAELDGKEVIAYAPATLIASINCESEEPGQPENCLQLYQLLSPTVDAPEGLDMQKLGAAMLQIIGYSPFEARQISERIDWASTLVLPIPQDADIEVSEVQVDGVTGTLISSVAENRFMLLWVKDGILYSLSGSGGTAEALEISNNMP